MSDQPLVSIVIPTYNRSELILNAVNSALNQTYSNVEIIVVDDNDPNSVERCHTKNKLATINDSRFIYIELDKNCGGCYARNKGIKKSNGIYINFLDDDDILLPTKIEKQVEVFLSSKEKLSVVGCFANIIDNEGNIVRKEAEKIRGNVFLKQLEKNICTTSIALIDKKVCVEAGGFVEMPSSQDHYFFIKMFEINPYYDYKDEILVNINHHDGPRVSTNKKKPQGAKILLSKLTPILEQLDKSEREKIEYYHHNNIAESYLSIGNNKKAREELFSNIKKYKKIKPQTIKYIFFSFIGTQNFYKLKGKILKSTSNNWIR